MLKKILNQSSKTITSAAIIIGAASLVSRLLGVLRDRVLAGQFGAGKELDMYYAAFRFPDLVFNLVVIGAISAGFIPVFSGVLKDQKIAWRLTNNILNVFILSIGLLTLILAIFAKPLTQLITPGFSANEIEITSWLCRIMFLSPIILGISAIWGGVCQSFKNFITYSLAPILYNFGIIIGALFFTPVLGIYGLAWGVVFGAALHMLIQLPPVLIFGYKYQFLVDLADENFQKIIKIMIPRILGILTSQVNFFLTTIIGSLLPIGTIAIFNLANNLQSFPLGIFGVAFAVAAFPSMSQIKENKNELIKIISSTTRQLLFFIIPSSALLIILRAQIVRAVLGSGQFDWQDTVLTLQALSIFALSLFAQALIMILSRAFYALQDSKTPFFVGLFAAIFNLILAYLLLKQGIAGLALAFSAANILNFILLWWLLKKQLGYLDDWKIWFFTGKILVATFILSISAQAIKYITEPIFGTNTFWGVTAQGFFAATVGLVFYLLICWLFKVEELNYFLDALKKKFGKKVVPPLEALENK